MIERQKVIKGVECCSRPNNTNLCGECPYNKSETRFGCMHRLITDVFVMLKEQEAVEPKTIPEELKQKMWNSLHAEEDKLEKKYVGTKEHNSWFLIYRPWLQAGFDLAIKAIADWEGQ